MTALISSGGACDFAPPPPRPDGSEPVSRRPRDASRQSALRAAAVAVDGCKAESVARLGLCFLAQATALYAIKLLGKEARMWPRPLLCMGPDDGHGCKKVRTPDGSVSPQPQHCLYK